MKFTVFIEEAVWEHAAPPPVSAEQLSRMVTANLERRFSGAAGGPALPPGRTTLAGLSLESQEQANSPGQLGQAIARAIDHGLNEKNW